MVIEITSKEEFEAVIASEKPVMVDFYASWCGPCKMAMPAVEYLGSTFEGEYVIAKANVEENKELAEQFGILKIPTFLFFKDGEQKDIMTGGDIRRRIMEEKLKALK